MYDPASNLPTNMNIPNLSTGKSRSTIQYIVIAISISSQMNDSNSHEQIQIYF